MCCHPNRIVKDTIDKKFLWCIDSINSIVDKIKKTKTADVNLKEQPLFELETF